MPEIPAPRRLRHKDQECAANRAHNKTPISRNKSKQKKSPKNVLDRKSKEKDEIRSSTVLVQIL